MNEELDNVSLGSLVDGSRCRHPRQRVCKKVLISYFKKVRILAKKTVFYFKTIKVRALKPPLSAIGDSLVTASNHPLRFRIKKAVR